jgi:hypothetical protein
VLPGPSRLATGVAVELVCDGGFGMERIFNDPEILRSEIEAYRLENRGRTRRVCGIQGDCDPGGRPWLDGVKEICAYCGFSRFALRSYRNKGFPVRKIAGRIVALRDDVDKWMVGRNFKRGRPPGNSKKLMEERKNIRQ